MAIFDNNKNQIFDDQTSSSVQKNREGPSFDELLTIYKPNKDKITKMNKSSMSSSRIGPTIKDKPAINKIS